MKKRNQIKWKNQWNLTVPTNDFQRQKVRAVVSSGFASNQSYCIAAIWLVLLHGTVFYRFQILHFKFHPAVLKFLTSILVQITSRLLLSKLLLLVFDDNHGILFLLSESGKTMASLRMLLSKC